MKHKNKKAKGHGLDELVKELDISIQEDIERKVISSWTSTKNPLHDYQKELTQNSLDFKEIRYVYEGKIHSNFEFLGVFNNVLFLLYEE